MRIVFIFSGQGAQSPGMGKDLYNSCGEAKKVFDEADSVLDWPVSELCFEGPAGKLTESRFCQPSIYTVSMACLAAFQEKYPNVKPEGCAGLSLGEFAALGAAGVFSFADGLKLVARRGVLMDNACHDTDGGMASVLGGDPEIISRICSECDVDVANYNCPGQIVISGEKSKVKQAIVALKEKGMRKIIP
jgi:[acyl-carrier-protein] S-malonyltransferase